MWASESAVTVQIARLTRNLRLSPPAAASGGAQRYYTASLSASDLNNHGTASDNVGRGSTGIPGDLDFPETRLQG